MLLGQYKQNTLPKKNRLLFFDVTLYCTKFRQIQRFHKFKSI